MAWGHQRQQHREEQRSRSPASAAAAAHARPPGSTIAEDEHTGGLKGLVMAAPPAIARAGRGEAVVSASRGQAQRRRREPELCRAPS